MRPSPAAFMIAVCLMATSLAGAKVKQASCTFTTFGAPAGYTLTGVGGIDDSGNVVGQLLDNKTGNTVAFTRFPNGSFSTYSVSKSYMTSFNHRVNAGVTVGSYEDQKLHIHGLVYNAGAMTAVNYPGASQSWLNGINDSGAVVGAYISGVHSHGFELAKGAYTQVSYPGALNTTLESINDKSMAVGYYQDLTLLHGITWQNGKFQVIDYPATKYGTILIDVNQSGTIVGNQLSSDFAFGFFYANGSFAKIVYNGAKAAYIGGINNNGVISGQILITFNNQPGYTAVCKY